MIYAIFLCDKTWSIQKILRQNFQLTLKEGTCLSSMIDNPEILSRNGDKYRCVPLTFTDQDFTLPALIHFFPEGALIILSHTESDADFMELFNAYNDSISWAEDHFQGLYHNEYYLIQQMNNQLIDSKRALARSNMRLEQLISEMKETNKQLETARSTAEKAMKIAEQANESKTRFMANISHDIRTPLNAILGLSALMEHELDHPETLKTYIQKLQYSGEHLLGLINDILDMSKIENGSVTLQEESVMLSEQIEQIHTIIRPQAEARSQIFEIQKENISQEAFITDATRLRQLLLNLLSNAVKYTPEGGRILLVIQECPASDPTQVSYHFTVSDTGIGMSEDFLRHIFEPFARSQLTAGTTQGTGLGMAIAKNIVDMMHGTIQVKSTLGKGSIFDVMLSFPKATHVQTAATPATSEETVSLDGKRFLCAEDNALNAEILTSMLELSGASCTIYENGQLLCEAFEQMKPGDYNAVLMDVQMPVMNGYEATQTIRNSANPLGASIPIIAMTANSFAEDIQRCLDCGMNAHISKPINMETLKQILSEYS